MPRIKGYNPQGGRNKFIIDWKVVDHFLMCGCTGTQVAAKIGVSADTLYDRVMQEFGVSFSEYLQEKRSTGETLVKEAQFDEAVRKRNTTMLVWVGKQLCGQTEKQEVRHEGNIPIQVVSYNGKPLEKWKDEKEGSDKSS